MSRERCSYKLAYETNILISVVGTLTRLSYISILFFLLQLLSLFLFVDNNLYETYIRDVPMHLYKKKILLSLIRNT